MLKPETLKFLKQLKSPSRGTKAWVDAHREERDAAVADLEAFADWVIAEVAKFDPAVAKAKLRGKDCVTRLNRDVRFHGGPSFKHDVHVVINPRGKKHPDAFYYVHVEAGNASAGGGVYAPESRDLLKFREGIAGEFTRIEKIISAKAFRTSFPGGLRAPSRAKTMPRGFNAEDPAADVIKATGFYTLERVTDRDLTTPVGFKKVVKLLKASRPLVDFLNHAYAKAPVARGGRKPNPQYPR